MISTASAARVRPTPASTSPKSLLRIDDVTSMVKGSRAVSPSWSWAVHVYIVRAWTAVGVPDKVRVSASNVSPWGRVIGVRAYVSGPSPPVASGKVRGVIAVATAYVCAGTTASPNVGIRSGATSMVKTIESASPSLSSAVSV